MSQPPLPEFLQKLVFRGRRSRFAVRASFSLLSLFFLRFFRLFFPLFLFALPRDLLGETAFSLQGVAEWEIVISPEQKHWRGTCILEDTDAVPCKKGNAALSHHGEAYSDSKPSEGQSAGASLAWLGSVSHVAVLFPEIF